MKWTNTEHQHSTLSDIPAKFSNINTHIYTLELYQPQLIFAMESKSETIRNLAYEMIHILTYLLQSEKQKYKDLFVFHNDSSMSKKIFALLLKYIGDQNLCLDESSQCDARQVSNTKLRVFHNLLGIYSIPAQCKVLEEQLNTFQKENNDKGISVITSVFYKPLFRSATAEEQPALLKHARDIWLPQTLNPLYNEDKFVLDIVDSLA